MTFSPKLCVRVLACLLIVTATFEVCARLEDKLTYHAPFFGPYNMDILYTYDDYGKRGKPDASFMKWRLNESGYRGPALRDGTYRIVCIGSSETFGLYESPEMEWPRQLEGLLNRQDTNPTFEVVNAAYPGMSTGAALRRLNATLAETHPNMVIVYPSYTPYIERGQPQPWPSVPESPARQPPYGSSFEWRISRRLQTLGKNTIPTRLQTTVREWQIRQDSSNGKVSDRLPEQNIEAFRLDLDHLTGTLLEHGVKVVLVTHANRFGGRVRPEERSVMIAWRKFFPELSEEGLLDMEARMSDVVREIGSKHHVPVVDAASLVPPGPQDFVEFVHFTDKGAGALASTIANAVQHMSGGVKAGSEP